MRFNCSECIFRKNIKMYSKKSMKLENHQVGCLADRLKLLDHDFIEVGGEEVASYDKLCMCKRTEAWEFAGSKDALDKMNSELSLMASKIGYVIVFNEDIETLKATISSIQHPQYVLVAYSKPEYAPEIMDILENANFNCPYYMSFMLKDVPYQEHMDEAIVKVSKKSGWMTLLKAGDVLPSQLGEKVFNRVYVENRRLGVCYDSSKDRILCQTAIFRFLGGNRPKIQEDGSIDNRNFFERLESMPISDPDLITSWESLLNE